MNTSSFTPRWRGLAMLLIMLTLLPGSAIPAAPAASALAAPQRPALTRFTDTATAIIGVDDSSVAWGDYNNDGKLDILLTGYDSGGNQRALVYAGNGQGGFTLDSAANLTGVGSGGAAWGDYNNDGLLDILLSGQDSASNRIAKVYTGDGQGGF